MFLQDKNTAHTAVSLQIRVTLIHKLSTLGLSSTVCNWVLNFLTDRPQTMKIHGNSSSPITLSTGSPQGCVLSPLLFTLLTHDCSAQHLRCLIVKFADDTAVVGRIVNSDESNYRQEVEHLEGWCRENNLCINVKKTKEMIGRHLPLPPLYIGGTAVEVVSSFSSCTLLIDAMDRTPAQDITVTCDLTLLTRSITPNTSSQGVCTAGQSSSQAKPSCSD